jgi:hypothetical protein
MGPNVGDTLYFRLRGWPGRYKGRVVHFDSEGKPIIMPTHGQPADKNRWYKTVGPVSRTQYRSNEYWLDLPPKGTL